MQVAKTPTLPPYSRNKARAEAAAALAQAVKRLRQSMNTQTAAQPEMVNEDEPLLSQRFQVYPSTQQPNRNMNPTVEELFAGIKGAVIQGDAKATIKHLSFDSRRVAPGALFFALQGQRTDGQKYVEDAVLRGACAVVAESATWAPPKTVLIQVPNVREAMAEVARRFYQNPQKGLELYGVTGTNGKTTVTTLLKHLLQKPSEPVGLLGTVAYVLGDRTLPAYRTTPEATEIYAMFAQMRDAGCKRGVMEVSSHGIDQRRVHKLPFKTVAFTNLTQDHLDYHGTMENYFAAKARLFTGGTGLLPQVAVINLDDAYGKRLLGLIPAGVRAVTFGLEEGADYRATNVELRADGTRFDLHWAEGTVKVESPLLGDYNVSNLLCALAMAVSGGEDIHELLRKLKSFAGVPGRMERIDCGQPFTALVDYAHTDDALRNALGMLRAITKGRLLLVFGCGGNRDRAKRPKMTKAAMEGADIVWATADNPRGEALPQIFADMAAGITDSTRITFIDDRRRAIADALAAAKPTDIVLIAGKGHETYQEFADTVTPFDDRAVVRELLTRANL